jgi:putative DNA primase/helicase
VNAYNPSTDQGQTSPTEEVVPPGERHPLFLNRVDAEAFLSALDPDATSHTFLTFDDNKKREDKNLTRVLPGTLGSRWDRLADLNWRGAGIFVVVNETDGEGIEAANVKRIRALFVDLDGAPLPAADAFHVKPHIVNESSPGKWHCYWLSTNCTREQFKALQKRLIRHYGGDPKITNTNRVMRLPGFVHQKVDKHGNACEPSVTRVAEAHDHAAYTVEAFVEGLPDAGNGAGEPNEGNGAAESNKGDGAAEPKSSTKPWTLAEEAKLRSALADIPTDESFLTNTVGDSHEVFVNIGRATERLGWREQGFAIWRDWCRGNVDKFDEKGLRTQWKSFHDTRDNGAKKPVTIGTIYHYAKVCRQATASAPAFSEEAIALNFANQHAADLRYVARWNQWFCWDGTCWREDETRKVFSIARGMCRELGLTINKPSESKRVASAKTRAAVVSLAGEDYRLAATVDQWDADLWLLNTPDGVVDLRTGETREHRADDYMTKQTAVTPTGECPRWKKFVGEVTGGDEGLQRFLQRWCGYALTGSTREHALGFGFGLGANGKSVFTGTVIGILADYATTAPIETFTVTNTEQHPTELARLRGARLVVATETEEGRRWAESKIKMLTGGDKTAARFMRQDFFEFTPQFKLWIVGNHKPGLRSVNEAIRRRFLLVPFDVVIAPAERDADLTEKLKSEWPGILRWMVDGALAWQRDGLAPPAAVTNATAAYLESEDAVALWLDECTVPDTSAWANSSDLFRSWKEWSEAAGEYTGTRRRFSQNLETKGLIPERRKFGRGYRGRRLGGPEDREAGGDDAAGSTRRML